MDDIFPLGKDVQPPRPIRSQTLNPLSYGCVVNYLYRRGNISQNRGARPELFGFYQHLHILLYQIKLMLVEFLLNQSITSSGQTVRTPSNPPPPQMHATSGLDNQIRLISKAIEPS